MQITLDSDNGVQVVSSSWEAWARWQNDAVEMFIYLAEREELVGVDGKTSGAKYRATLEGHGWKRSETVVET